MKTCSWGSARSLCLCIRTGLSKRLRWRTGTPGRAPGLDGLRPGVPGPRGATRPTKDGQQAAESAEAAGKSGRGVAGGGGRGCSFFSSPLPLPAAPFPFPARLAPLLRIARTIGRGALLRRSGPGGPLRQARRSLATLCPYAGRCPGRSHDRPRAGDARSHKTRTSAPPPPAVAANEKETPMGAAAADGAPAAGLGAGSEGGSKPVGAATESGSCRRVPHCPDLHRQHSKSSQCQRVNPGAIATSTHQLIHMLSRPWSPLRGPRLPDPSLVASPCKLCFGVVFHFKSFSICAFAVVKRPYCFRRAGVGGGRG